MKTITTAIKALTAIALTGIAFGASAAPAHHAGLHRHHVRHHGAVHHRHHRSHQAGRAAAHGH